MQKSKKLLNPIKICEDTFCKEYSKKNNEIIKSYNRNNYFKQ